MLQNLFHHRWALPVLAELHRLRGAKFVTLVNRLGANRATLRKTLDSLVAHGWVARNPGYGHPMRPEYVLTERGAAIAPACVRLLERAESLGCLAAATRKWPMPVLAATLAGATRFAEIRQSLPALTARALSLALTELQDAGLLERTIEPGHPPRTRYRCARPARTLAAPLRAIARAA